MSRCARPFREAHISPWRLPRLALHSRQKIGSNRSFSWRGRLGLSTRLGRARWFLQKASGRFFLWKLVWMQVWLCRVHCAPEAGSIPSLDVNIRPRWASQISLNTSNMFKNLGPCFSYCLVIGTSFCQLRFGGYIHFPGRSVLIYLLVTHGCRLIVHNIGRAGKRCAAKQWRSIGFIVDNLKKFGYLMVTRWRSRNLMTEVGAFAITIWKRFAAKKYMILRAAIQRCYCPSSL